METTHSPAEAKNWSCGWGAGWNGASSWDKTPEGQDSGKWAQGSWGQGSWNQNTSWADTGDGFVDDNAANKGSASSVGAPQNEEQKEVGRMATETLVKNDNHAAEPSHSSSVIMPEGEESKDVGTVSDVANGAVGCGPTSPMCSAQGKEVVDIQPEPPKTEMEDTGIGHLQKMEDKPQMPEPEVQESEQPQEHPHQNEEWYQKWLRRQQNKPRQIIEIGKPPEPELPPSEDSTEQRLCLDDGKAYTFKTLKATYGGQYKEPDLIAYWKVCRPVIDGQTQEEATSGSTGGEDGRKAYENEEWYQKWLRRQQNKPRQIIELGKPQESKPLPPPDENSSEKRLCPDDNKEYTFRQLKETYGKEYSTEDLIGYWNYCKSASVAAEATPAAVSSEGGSTEDGKKGYENEEWYQKWLRRQQNKGRQIIEIGKPQEPEPPPSEDSNEKRLCPDDGKAYTFKSLKENFGKQYSATDLIGYWKTCALAPMDQPEQVLEKAVVPTAGLSEEDGSTENGKNLHENEKKQEHKDRENVDIVPNLPEGSGEKPKEEKPTEAVTVVPPPSDSPSEGHDKKIGENDVQHPFKQDEWYQKWLRKQEDKNRQIIESGKPQEQQQNSEAKPSMDAHEKRLCPDDGKEYTFKELSDAFSTYSAERLDVYWRDTMKVTVLPNNVLPPREGPPPGGASSSSEALPPRATPPSKEPSFFEGPSQGTQKKDDGTAKPPLVDCPSESWPHAPPFEDQAQPRKTGDEAKKQQVHGTQKKDDGWAQAPTLDGPDDSLAKAHSFQGKANPKEVLTFVVSGDEAKKKDDGWVQSPVVDSPESSRKQESEKNENRAETLPNKQDSVPSVEWGSAWGSGAWDGQQWKGSWSANTNFDQKPGWGSSWGSGAWDGQQWKGS